MLEDTAPLILASAVETAEPRAHLAKVRNPVVETEGSEERLPENGW